MALNDNALESTYKQLLEKAIIVKEMIKIIFVYHGRGLPFLHNPPILCGFEFLDVNSVVNTSSRLQDIDFIICLMRIIGMKS